MSLRSSHIANTLIIQSLKGISKLPFPLLYALSDFLSLILQYLVGYRKKVIRTNLRKAFPEKPEQEIRRIVRAFYRHFCDISLETAKAWSMTEAEFDKRVVISGKEYLDNLYADGKSVILLGMHYNNWEWSAWSQKLLKYKYLVVYNPVRGNPMFEEYLLTMRERWGAQTIPVHKSARVILDFHNLNQPVCLALGGDQRPPTVSKYWTLFMNQEACFNSGPVKIAQRTNQPVVFLHTRKLKRGYYEMKFIPMFDNPKEHSEEEILLAYVRLMEECIREAPEYYLWSHKRWKQQRPEDYPLFL